MMGGRLFLGTAIGAIGMASAPAWAMDAPLASSEAATQAKLFGSLEQVWSMSLSPDGKHAVAVSPGPGQATYAIVIDTQTREPHLAARQDGKPTRIQSCGWASNTRLVCQLHGVVFDNDPPFPYTRTVAFDLDGKNPAYIGRRVDVDAIRLSQFDGKVIDWLQGEGSVLMVRDHVPQDTRGEHADYGASGANGLAVDRVDTMTGRGEPVERPDLSTTSYFSDGAGNVRIRATKSTDDEGRLTGGTTYFYRQAGDKHWQVFSKTRADTNEFAPIAVDGTRNVAYAVKTLNGRNAVYSVALDGSFKAELVSSNPQVDVDDIITLGRHGRVIGVSYITDRRQTDYFDPEYKQINAMLAKAMPGTPLIHFLDASADEKKLLIYAGSDTDPGHYYVYDKATHHLDELSEVRPNLADLTMAPMKLVSFKATDGTVIPAYLTLPVAGAGKKLPAIIMPHGGPDYRDSWGFDWLVQFFAQRGYAVLQPEYRGSSGYGDAFYAHNGFHGWQTAMGDICEAGRWLVKEGIADPDKLAIVGWSYGGYAALQANVAEPKLFKAIVAIAPVTDLGRLKSDASGYTNSILLDREIGSGENVGLGSPARHADRIVAPVLMFHGDHDLNVSVAHSRLMDQALRKAGVKSSLVVFPGLGHQLDDADARAELLAKTDDFLHTALHM